MTLYARLFVPLAALALLSGAFALPAQAKGPPGAVRTWSQDALNKLSHGVAIAVEDETGMVQRRQGSQESLAPVARSSGAPAPGAFESVGRNVLLSTDNFPELDYPDGERQVEPHIAINPTNPKNLIGGAQEGRFFAGGGAQGSGFYVSTNGGRSWTAGLIPGASQATGGEFPRATDPVIAFGPDGTAYFVSLSFSVTSVPHAILVNRSTDGGKTWSDPIEVVREEDPRVFLDKQWITVDNSPGSDFFGRIYVTWSDFIQPNINAVSAIPIQVVFSDDGGNTWSDRIEASGATDIFNQGSQPMVGPDGLLYVVYFQFTPDRLRIVKSADGGETWSDPVTISKVQQANLPGLRTADFLPAAAIDASTGTIHVTWQDSRNDVADILYSRSIDGGETWSEPIRVNDDPPGEQQFTAAVTAVGGVVHIVFYDGRDAEDRGDLYNLVYAQSLDDGESFLANIPVTSQAFDMDFAAPTSGGLFLGDYIAIVASEKTAHPIWVDTRQPSLYTAAEGQNDVLSARISK